jgi:hypothetical protein
MIRAYCYASGLIEFGTEVPKGARFIASGPSAALRRWIRGNARIGYRTRIIGGRRTVVPGTDHLLVPGIAEADSELTAALALARWRQTIRTKRPRGVRVRPQRVRRPVR